MSWFRVKFLCSDALWTPTLLICPGYGPAMRIFIMKYPVNRLSIMSGEKRHAMLVETNMAIIKKLDSGAKMVNVARAFIKNRSTVGKICKSKHRITEYA
ncbi:hypothetical protein SK128_020880 [Halocaridina rubra]|uniref:HTH psq-type domain-containing protein n=1 Tax=Halocaridina rubra TaxID=373956 RepID=A0AAN8ZZS0_HALRR